MGKEEAPEQVGGGVGSVSKIQGGGGYDLRRRRGKDRKDVCGCGGGGPANPNKPSEPNLQTSARFSSRPSTYMLVTWGRGRGTNTIDSHAEFVLFWTFTMRHHKRPRYLLVFVWRLADI